MDAKHTPGPWWIDTEDFGDLFPGHVPISAKGHGALAQVVWRIEGYDQSPTCEANARLIAAAPDLLEALLGVLRVADRATDEFDAARAAIAKATGSAA